MRYIKIVMILLFTFGALLAADYQLIESKSGKSVTLAKMASKLRKADVIFFGEFHGNAVIHRLQAELLPQLYQAKKRLIVSFEMLERDVQPDLDAYLAGSITEEEFLQRSRPWPNYATDYRSLLEFAKEKELKVIAANIPRWIAGKVARGSLAALDDLDADDRMHVAIDIDTSEGAYKDSFLATMQMNGVHDRFGDEQLYERLYQAQCVKDDTMAESIAQYRERYPKHTIIHFNGDFHSTRYLGTVERLRNRMPKLKIAVISPVYADAKTKVKPREQADYIIKLNQREEEEDQ
jgi:uncharacterized iron-regulated protein